MEILDLGPEWFAFIRRSQDGQETIACLFNLTDSEQKLPARQLHAGLGRVSETRDLLGGETVATGPRRLLRLPPYFGRWLLVPGA